MKKTYLIFGAILILVLAGAVFVREKREIEPIPQSPVITPPPPVVAPPINQTNQTPQGWKTYRSEEFGFEISYPGEWFTYDKAKLENDDKVTPCIGLELKDMLILSKKNLGKCVGPSGDSILIGDFSIYIFNAIKELDSIGKSNESGSRIEIIHISGERALKAYFTEESVRPRDYSVNIYLNHEGRNYMMLFPQIDLNYHYNSVFDQILSTFRFLK